MVALVAALVAVLVVRPWRQDRARYRRAAVAASGYECAGIGRSILEKNGSAVDAAIATLFCEGIACAQCMGLGGGFLATVYDATTQQVSVLNSRERAPAKATETMFANVSSTVGGLAIAVPGELRGYGELHRKFGRLDWAEIVKPTADLCRRGHRVNSYMARVLKSYSTMIKNEPSMRELYVNPATDEVWNEGDLITEPTLAETLDIIAVEGPEAMHNGSLTSRLVEDIAKFGGIITEDDMNNYMVEWQDPIEVPLIDGQTLYSSPLPGSGSVLAFILNMLYGWIGQGTDVPVGSNLYWHRIVETFKYAYAKRTGLGDKHRNNLPYNMDELERNLSTPSWARSFRELVNDEHTYNDWRHYGALFGGADDHGTAHVIVVAPDGSVVSATSTINFIWGSQRRSTSLGIMLNNEMDDFATNRVNVYGMPPSPANFIKPGLQPMSSMAPSIVLKKNEVEGQPPIPTLVLGAAGGTKITTQVALTVTKAIFEGERLDEVIPLPRLHHQLLPMEVQIETDFDHEIVESLIARGHNVSRLSPTAGFAAFIGAQLDEEGYWVPVTDKRRPGSVDGLD